MMKRKPGVPLIETERLVLTLPPPERASRMLDFVKENQEHLTPWSPHAPAGYYTHRFWVDRLRSARQEFKQGQSLRLVLSSRDAPTEKIQGVCNFTGIMRGPFQACYLGYSLDHRAVAKGLMFEALEAAIKYVFGTMCLHRIMANYMPQNERSARLLKRLGFEVEGFAHKYLLIAGEWRDHVLTALTNPGVEV